MACPLSKTWYSLPALLVLGCPGPRPSSETHMGKSVTEDAGAESGVTSFRSSPVEFDLPVIQPLDSLPGANAWLLAQKTGDLAAIAEAAEKWIATGTISADHRCALQYRVLQAARTSGQSDVARTWALRLVESSQSKEPCALASYGAWSLAERSLKEGHFDEAVRWGSKALDPPVADFGAMFVVAEAYLALRDREGVVRTLETFRSTFPRTETEVRARLLLARGELLGDMDGAREAFRLSTDVWTKAPWSNQLSSALALRTEASTALTKGRVSLASDPSWAERTRQVEALAETGHASSALEKATDFLRHIPKKAADLRCRVMMVRAETAWKLRRKTRMKWLDAALSQCKPTTEAARAWKMAAHLHATLGDRDVAIRLYEELANLDSKFRLEADYERGLLLVRSGDETAAMPLLDPLIEISSDDARAQDALFRSALYAFRQGDYERAKPRFERLVQLTTTDRHWATAARAHYFSGRVAQAQQRSSDAREWYSRAIAHAPLSFYMSLAHARLAEIDVAEAEQALGFRSTDRRGGEVIRVTHYLERPAFRRGFELALSGELEAARLEWRDFATKEPLATWLPGAMWNRIGRPSWGYLFARSATAEFLAHAPVDDWRFVWEQAFPVTYEALVREHAKKYRVPLSLVWAVMREESGFSPDAKSSASAFGLMQLIVPTAKYVAKGTTILPSQRALCEPTISIELGSKLLAQLRRSFSSQPVLAIPAYNAGAGAVHKWLREREGLDLDVFVELIPYDETRGYIKRVVASQAAYAYLYAPDELSEVMRIPLHPKS